LIDPFGVSRDTPVAPQDYIFCNYLHALQNSRWNRFSLVGLSDQERLASGNSMVIDFRGVKPVGEYWDGNPLHEVIEYSDHFNTNSSPLYKIDYLAHNRMDNLFEFKFYRESVKDANSCKVFKLSNIFKNYMTYGAFRRMYYLLGEHNPFQVKKLNASYVIPGFRAIQDKEYFTYFQDRLRHFMSRRIHAQSYYGRVYDDYYVFRENIEPADGEFVFRVVPFTIKPSFEP
jgi:hypothetical protein